MVLVLTLLCRNEADIIASTVEFHLRSGVDFIVAMDNGSTDGTTSILQGYERQGLLRLLHEPRHTHDQAVWVSEMARLAAEDHGADWVIPCDADEFWWPQSGSLAAELAQVPEDVMAVEVERLNFLPPAAGAPAQIPFHQLQTVRERQSLNSLGHPLPPKVCHRAHPEITVCDGNHGVFLNGVQLPGWRHSNLEILHFPVRSYAQLERKIRQGSEALARNTRVSPNVGITWRRLYSDHLLAGTLPDYDAGLRPADDVLAEAVARGDLVRDHRLAVLLAGERRP